MSNLEENEKIIASAGSQSNTIVFTLDEYEGRRTLDIRKFYFNKTKKEFKPTKKGISLSESTYAIVKNILNGNHDKIIEWLEGNSNVPAFVLKTEKEEKESAKNAKYIAKKSQRSKEKWKDLTFFDTKAEGGKDNIIFNENHPFISILEKINFMLIDEEDKKKRLELLKTLQELFDIVLISFSRAHHLFDNTPVINPQSLIENLMFNWGAILKEYIKEKHDLE